MPDFSDASKSAAIINITIILNLLRIHLVSFVSDALDPVVHFYRPSEWLWPETYDSQKP